MSLRDIDFLFEFFNQIRHISKIHFNFSDFELVEFSKFNFIILLTLQFVNF